ncbi:hypothetical protein LJR029_005480 [Caballeronia sp. LjRoot29]
MKLKLTNDGDAAVRNGRPVYVGDDGDDGERAFDEIVAHLTRNSLETKNQ